MRVAGTPTATPGRSRRPPLLLVLFLAGLLVSQAAPAAAGGKPMPAGGKPMPLTSGQRSVAAADRQVAAVLAANPGSRRLGVTSVLLAPGVVMTVPGPVPAGSTMTSPSLAAGA